jgi:hypothetical protein
MPFMLFHFQPFSSARRRPLPLPLSAVLIVLNLPIRVTDSGRARVKGAINTAAHSTKVCMLIVFGVHMFGLYVNFE